MRVVTTAILPKPPDQVWPLLCSSKMDAGVACPFRLGIPKPVQCRLPEGRGGVGQERQCISNRGVINQQITRWEAPRLLQFRMKDTTLYFRPCVSSIVEEFDLAPLGPSKTRITRTTTVEATGMAAWAKELIMCAGMKFIHRYVFENWSRQLA